MRISLKVLIFGIVLTIFGVRASYGSDLMLIGAKIYPSPNAPPIEQGSILIHDGRIAEVGPAASVKTPRKATVLDCTGLVITAGFWNSHVHILTPGLIHADKLSPDETTEQLRAMLTKWGFTTVFDIASVLKNTNLIRHRIASGETRGPRILTVGEPFWIATPIYVKSFLEANDVDIPSVHSTAEAKVRVEQEIREGADGIKIFANSIEPGEILTVPEELAQSIVEEAHAHHKPVFAHVSNNAGIEIALHSGVDILAHTTPIDTPWSAAFAQRLVAAHMALTPTLTLWEFESRKGSISSADLKEGMQRAAQQLNAFQSAGGDVLFGTDVGYTDIFETSEEFKWMARGGMSFQQILASLTTNPARRFGFDQHSGRIAKDYDADLVVLRSDPAHDPTAFAGVQYTIRSGRVIYKRDN
jgi:imidazolonepropionase-like amidohydrolase